MTRSTAKDHERAWDFHVQENIRTLKDQQGLTFDDLVSRLERETRESWSNTRAQDLFGAHGLREYKWREVVALAPVFGVGILDIVMPDEHKWLPTFVYLSNSFGLPPDVLVRESRDRARRSRIEDWWLEVALQNHPQLSTLADIRTRFDQLNSELLNAGPEQMDRVRGEASVQASLYETESDRLRTQIKRGAIPSPLRSKSFQAAVDTLFEQGTTRPSMIRTEDGSDWPPEMQPVWSNIWQDVWDEAAAEYEQEDSDGVD